MSSNTPPPSFGTPEHPPGGTPESITPELFAALLAGAVRDGLDLHTQGQQEAYRQAMQDRADRAHQTPGQQDTTDPTQDPDYVDPAEQAKANADYLRWHELHQKTFTPPVRALGRAGLTGTAARQAYGSADPADRSIERKNRESRWGKIGEKFAKKAEERAARRARRGN